jgi:hypothetical protein
VVNGQRVVQADLDFLAWSAIAAFVAVAVFNIVILLPWTWGFVPSPKVLFEDHVDVPERNTPAQLHRFLAETLEAQWDQNQKKLNRLFWCFRLACFAFERRGNPVACSIRREMIGTKHARPAPQPPRNPIKPEQRGRIGAR